MEKYEMMKLLLKINKQLLNQKEMILKQDYIGMVYSDEEIKKMKVYRQYYRNIFQFFEIEEYYYQMMRTIDHDGSFHLKEAYKQQLYTMNHLLDLLDVEIKEVIKPGKNICMIALEANLMEFTVLFKQHYNEVLK